MWEDSNDTLRKELDWEIARLENLKYIRVLKTNRNALSPIAKLPAELLLNVFLELAFDSGRPVPDSDVILIVAQVCRHWRMLAVTSPLLWSYIDLASSSFHPATMIRWRDAPLTLSLKLNRWAPKLSRWRKDFVFWSTSRIQELTFDCDPSNAKKLMNSLDATAPLLRVVKMKCDFWPNEEASLRSGVFRFLNRPMPRLKKLTLRVPIDWSWEVFTRIIHLHLDHINEPELLSALSRMQSLEFLEVTHCVPRSPPSYTSIIQPKDAVALASLRGLKLRSFYLQDCSYFINHIGYPHFTNITVEIEADLATSDVQIPPCPPFYEPGKHLEIIWEQNNTQERVVRFASSLFSLTFEGFRSKAMKISIPIALETLSQTWSVDSLRLRMKEDQFYLKSDWLALLGYLTNLVRLEVNLNGSWRSLVDSLALPISRQKSFSRGKGPILIPHLRKLVIRFDSRELKDEVDYFGALRRVLRARCDFGVRISVVRVVAKGSSSINQEQKEELSRLVDTFEWRD